MLTDFSDDNLAKNYLKFSNSDEGQKQHDLLWHYIEPRLAGQSNLKILDAGCGTGWLANNLRPYAQSVKAFDSSSRLLEYGKEHSPQVNFLKTDLADKLPFADQEFDLVVASLVLHDLPKLPETFQEFRRILKPQGKLLIIELNSYYAYPVGSWTRTIWQKLTRLKPKLTISPYGDWKRRIDRKFAWGEGFNSYFYTLPEIINAAHESGWNLEFMEDLIAKSNSEKLDLHFRAYRFPIFILLAFRKQN